MKIYEIAFFLLIMNLVLSVLCGMNILPVHVSTLQISENDFKSSIPEDISYSDADIGMYIFGDFPRAISMLVKIFVFAPAILALLLGEAGISAPIVTLLGILTWIVYLTGLGQLIGKLDVKGGE